MNANLYTTVLGSIYAFSCILSSNASSQSIERGEWQTHIYPKIGLKIDLPPWKMEIDDQDRSWSLMAFPLVQNPASDVQYRVTVSAFKLTEEQYMRLYRKLSTESPDWASGEHLRTDQMTNAFWIYARRDVIGSNGFAYNSSARVKRLFAQNPGATQSGGSEQKLALDVRRILDSIEVLSTNLSSRLLPKSIQPSPASNSDKQTGDLKRLFNAMTPAEIERVKEKFARLRPDMSPGECFDALGVNLQRQYPASTWGLPGKQSVSLMLAQDHVLLLEWDARSSPAKLLAVQLDDLKWPGTTTAQKP